MTYQTVFILVLFHYMLTIPAFIVQDTLYILQDIENHLNQDLRDISDWYSCNQLALNTKKCETMLSGTIQKMKKIEETNLDLFIDNIKLNQVTVCKYLGVNIDNSLDLDKHVEHLCKSAVKNLYLLKRIRHCISQKTHYSFIVSGQLPPGQSPPGKLPPGKLPPKDNYPLEIYPPENYPPRTITPQGQLPPGKLPPGKLPPEDNYPPRTITPRKITPRRITPRGQLPPEDNYPPRTITPEDNYPRGQLPPEDNYPPRTITPLPPSKHHYRGPRTITPSEFVTL